MYEMMRGFGHRLTLDPENLTLDLRFSGVFRRALAFARREIRIRNDVAKAAALDDRLLADIAVARRDIKHAVRGDTWMLERKVLD